jgi:hypothetical protein
VNETAFHAWLLVQGFDQQSWVPELLQSLRRRYEQTLGQIVIDGRDCQWPQRVHRVSRNENSQGN